MIPTKHRIQRGTNVTIDCRLTLLLHDLTRGTLGEGSEIVGHAQLIRSDAFLVRSAWRRLNLWGRAVPLTDPAAGLRARTRHHDREVAGRQALAAAMRHSGSSQVCGELGHGPACGQHGLDLIEHRGHSTLQQRVSGPSPQRFHHLG